MVYVVRKSSVAQSLARLRGQKTHTLFVGYLYLQQRAFQLGRLEDLQPDFSWFFKHFFFVGNHPLGAPYIKLFTQQRASMQNLWLNENVAGSYAPSSLRPDQPFRQVVNIDSGTYTLPPDHAERAYKHLLYSVPIQVADLAIVLYRDFGLLGDTITIEDVVSIFMDEFGYSGESNNDFRTLYTLPTTQNWEYDWLKDT